MWSPILNRYRGRRVLHSARPVIPNSYRTGGRTAGAGSAGGRSEARALAVSPGMPGVDPGLGAIEAPGPGGTVVGVGGGVVPGAGVAPRFRVARSKAFGVARGIERWRLIGATPTGTFRRPGGW